MNNILTQLTSKADEKEEKPSVDHIMDSISKAEDLKRKLASDESITTKKITRRISIQDRFIDKMYDDLETMVES